MGDPLAELLALPEVFEAVDAARGAVDSLLNDLRRPRQRTRIGGIKAEALRRSAQATSELAQEEPDVFAGHTGGERPGPHGERGQPGGEGDHRDGLIRDGAVRVYSELEGLARTWAIAPLQALARLHALAAVGLAGPDERGRPRPVPGVADRLAALADLVTARSAAPAVILAAVVHGELAATRPFGTVDGVVARAASRLVLVSTGLDPWALTIPEHGHLELAPQYRRTLVDYQSGTPDGVARWLVHCASAVAVGAHAARQLAAELAGGTAADGGRRDAR